MVYAMQDSWNDGHCYSGSEYSAVYIQTKTKLACHMQFTHDLPQMFGGVWGKFLESLSLFGLRLLTYLSF